MVIHGATLADDGREAQYTVTIHYTQHARPGDLPITLETRGTGRAT